MSRTTRISGAVAVAAAGAMMIAPALAHADGTKDPAYNHPPKKSQPKQSTPRQSTPKESAPKESAPKGKSAPVTKCGQLQKAGNNVGVVNYPAELGRSGPTSFVFDYNAENVPDKFDVLWAPIP